jgi:DNA-binding transcriptional MerR regulator
MAGVSARTLRYYDSLGLLSPVRVSSNGYRLYGEAEVDRLQQILFYRELGLPLEEIRNILSAPEYDGTAALEDHLAALTARRKQIDELIANVKKTLQARKGEITMTDKEKFDGFGQKLIEENEKRHGEEIRRRYGGEAVEKSNEKVRGMSREDYAETERLRCEAEGALREAFAAGDPAGPPAQRACELHKQWLCRYTDGYSKEYHKALAQLYVEDPRFTAYYDNIAPGCAAFLHDALMIYCRS